MYNSVIEVQDLIGVPFEKGGRSLVTGVDCFGLLMECQRRLGKPIPDHRSPEFHHEIAAALHDRKADWTQHYERTGADPVPLSACKPGSALLIKIRGCACHVGFVHKDGWFIHTWEDTNGVTQERISLWRQRILGVYEYHGGLDA